MSIPANLLYTKDHEWARIEGKNAHVGITDYAQHSLGDITFVELPKNGEKVKQSGFCATVESVKAASEVYAPLSGTVIASNQDLAAHPELVNQAPYEKGYLFTIELTDGAEKAKLMGAPSYERYLQGFSK
jgi:glycine cleavage system H protein